MSKKEPRRFAFERVKRKGRWKGFLLGFVAFILIFGIAAGAYLYTKTDMIGADKIMSFFEERMSDADDEHVKNVSANFLFMSISSEETLETGTREIYFMVLAHADTRTKKIKFCPLPIKQNYLRDYEAGGESEIVRTLEKEYNIKINHYVSSNENTFALAINYMGGLQYSVPENVTYRTKDLTLIITSGNQTIKGETLVKYLKYYKETDPQMIGTLFCKMAENYLTAENYKDAMKLYKGVLSNLSDNSDITYVDMANHLNELRVFTENPVNNAETVSSVDAL